MFQLQAPNIDLLKREFSQIHLNAESSYFLSYPEFLAYFQQLPVIDSHSFIIAAHFTYGWMPKILTIGKGDTVEAVKLLNQVKAGVFLQKGELERLKGIVNNSLVGVSKLLHFINPNLYGIWDSHVARYLTEKTLSDQSMKNVTLYIDYLNICQSTIERPEYEYIHSNVVEKIGYDMTQLRTLEVLMFWISRTRKQKTSKRN